MAQRATSDSRPHLKAPSSPLQISKDAQGSDNPIPLSPQWLLPKHGENKSGTGTVDNHLVSSPSFGHHAETFKASGNGEDVHEAHKRKDVFRPSMLDSESGRRDRWRDEERDIKSDIKSSIRKDRWRDGDKDLGDAWKAERWTENLSARNFGETRRGASDRWNDSGSKETNFDPRRENKWSTRWGPDNKEPEGPREKWSDSGRDGDTHLDKGLSHLSNHGKDEKEGDHHRPWRPSFTQGRGRVEPPHPQNTTPNKQASTFSYGRGRGENMHPVSTLGHGRAGFGGSSMNSTYPATISDKVETGQGEHSQFKYSRAKLLDVYRVTNMDTGRKLVEDFVQVPNITHDEPSEPLALFAPNSEELSVLKGIDKGEITSSGAPQVTKDGRGSADFTHSRRIKPGIAPLQDRSEDEDSYKVSDEVPSNRDSSFEGNSSVHSGVAWRAMPMGEHGTTLVHDSRVVASDVGKWKSGEDPAVRRQLSGYLDSELETRRAAPTPPEELPLLYKDPKGQVQGPFKGIDIIGWFEAGYFGIDLPVRLENSAADSPWLSLGDVMPHLRAKARPPPGFTAPKPNDFTDIPGQQNAGPFANTLPGLSEVDMLRRQSSATEAENRFLESLMSGNKSSPPLESLTLPEGLQGFLGNNAGNLGPSGVDSGNNIYLLAKKLAYERQRSLSNSYPYWQGRDATSLAPKSDIALDASMHSKLLSSVSDNSRQPQSQNAELLSIIQGLSDRTTAGLNNGAGGWPSFPKQGGLDPLQNKVDLHHDPNFPQVPFGIQQQRLQVQNQLSLNNLLAQVADGPSGILAAEKLLSSGLAQDPQILNILQQQYLLQMHSQAAAPAQQMQLLEKLLLLKQQQQQKQEEQQQLLRQQQQKLLSQVLQDQQSSQHLGESTFGHLQGGTIPMGNLRMDPTQLQPQDIFSMGSQTPITSTLNEVSTNPLNLPFKVSQDTSFSVSTDASSLKLPHQLFDNSTSSQKNWGPIVPEQINEQYQKEMYPASTLVESSLLYDQNNLRREPQIAQEPLSVSDFTAKSVDQMLDSTFRSEETGTTATPKPDENSDHVQCAPVAPISTTGSCGIELPPVNNIGMAVKVESVIVHEEQNAGKDSNDVDGSSSALQNVAAPEPKKVAEKKSKKQKSSKSQSSDQAKGLLKHVTSQPSKQSELEKPNTNDVKLGKPKEGVADKGDHAYEADSLPADVAGSITEADVRGESKVAGSVTAQSFDIPAGRAWKAPPVKAKSLLEIQMEEQRKAEAEAEMHVSEIATSVSSMSLTTPWAGVVANPDSAKVFSDSQPEPFHNLKTKKSPLHDLLAEEVLKKSNESDAIVPDSITSSQNIAVQSELSESLDDSNFIEAKDTKRGRKKSAKSKGSGVKALAPFVSDEVPIATSPVDKGKSSCTLQQEKEVLPAIPAGSSLGDFITWKGEKEPPSPSPSPAWSTDSARVPKPTSLRDILKEQEKKSSSAVALSSMPAPKKVQPAQSTWNSGSSWSTSASSPSKAASPIQINSHASSQSKNKGDDDLFWGPMEQSKQETKQSDFPQLACQGSWGSKNAPIKGNSPAVLTRQKSVSGKPAEQRSLLSSSPASSQSNLKSKKDAMSKQSEAMGFRDWCENECIRLIGTKDTSFLEYCLKQSKSEAEMLLIENLGSYDPDHEFIDKFLDYKELLPSDVLEIAFQSKTDQQISGMGSGGKLSANAADVQDADNNEGSSKGGGKKKGKKGKKVSPAVLGFNVVSNRIMMGEIQTLED